MRNRRFRFSYANVISTLALFVALGGTAVATGVIDGKKIKPGSITGKQVKAKSIPGSDLRPNSVRGRQIREATLARVPSAQSADLAAVAEIANNLSPAATAGLIDRCDSGTTPFAGVCIDTERRGSATWPAAAKVCGEAGGQLPGLEIMEGFRKQPGVTWVGYEHTTAYLDLNGLASGGEMTVGISDSGSLGPGHDYGNSNAGYRCVFPATNR